MPTLTKDEIKNRVCQAIEKGQPFIRELAAAIAAEPELGFKEVKTSQKVQNAFSRLGISFTSGHAITGVKGQLHGGMKSESKVPTVALLGELDAIVNAKHPMADPLTGAAHCCGHNVQIANLLAVAMGLQAEGVLENLCGNVVLFAVPAEEFVEIDYRNRLREEGKLKYQGGKQQLIYEGAFDDIDMALQMHVDQAQTPEGEMCLGTTSNGFVGKLIEYHGRAAHAAAAPEDGINALQGAMLGLMGVNAIRDTFKDTDSFRFHPIINHGGDLVNVVPDLVTMESYVRCSNVEAMLTGNQRVNRALIAGGTAVGAEVTIKDIPGYLPMRNDATMNQFLEDNSVQIFGADHVMWGTHKAASTDTGDVAHIMPVIHPWVGCISGVLHGADYAIQNDDVAYIKTPQALAMTIVDLLYDQAQGANSVLEHFKPVFTKEEYLKTLDSIG